VLPLLEEDGRACHDCCGEQHVVNGCDHRCIEDVQGFVQVVDLDADADNKAYQEHPAKWFFQNWLPRKQFFQGNPQAFDAGHRKRADGRTDQNINQDVALSVTGSSHKDKQKGAHQDAHSKYNESLGKEELKSSMRAPVTDVTEQQVEMAASVCLFSLHL